MKSCDQSHPIANSKGKQGILTVINTIEVNMREVRKVG
jgi:hypothetical protein